MAGFTRLLVFARLRLAARNLRLRGRRKPAHRLVDAALEPLPDRTELRGVHVDEEAIEAALLLHGADRARRHAQRDRARESASL